MGQQFCGQCGEQKTKGSVFCGECGAAQDRCCLQCKCLNESGARFCADCGQALPIVCSVCRTMNESGVDFCAECGVDFNHLTAIADGKRKGVMLWNTILPVALISIGALMFWPESPVTWGNATSGSSGSSSRFSTVSSSLSSSTNIAVRQAASCSDLVSFSFDGPGFETEAQISLSVPSGQYVNGNGSSNVSVGSNGGCIGGSFDFSYSNNVTIIGTSSDAEWRTYSGSFSVPSIATYCSVTISDGFGVSVGIYC